MKLPMVFVQLYSQPPFPVLHSSMSMKQQGILFKGIFMLKVVSIEKIVFKGLKLSVQVQLRMKERRSE